MTLAPPRPPRLPAGDGRSTRFPLAGLLALAVATFLSISGEMLPTGLLPEMSSELGVTESAIGLLVSVFAFTVVLTSTTLTHLTRRLPRHLQWRRWYWHGCRHRWSCRPRRRCRRR